MDDVRVEVREDGEKLIAGKRTFEPTSFSPTFTARRFKVLRSLDETTGARLVSYIEGTAEVAVPGVVVIGYDRPLYDVRLFIGTTKPDDTTHFMDAVKCDAAKRDWKLWERIIPSHVTFGYSSGDNITGLDSGFYLNIGLDPNALADIAYAVEHGSVDSIEIRGTFINLYVENTYRPDGRDRYGLKGDRSVSAARGMLTTLRLMPPVSLDDEPSVSPPKDGSAQTNKLLADIARTIQWLAVAIGAVAVALFYRH